MEKVYIGYVQGVHGLRGDLKIKNRFENPEQVFVKGNRLFLNKEEHLITNSKFYKGFYLVTIDNLKDINLVEKYKGFEVYFAKEDLKLDEDEYILDDLFGMDVISGGKDFGKVKDILDNGIYKILVVDNPKSLMIPLIEKYVKKVDVANRIIECEDVEELIL